MPPAAQAACLQVGAGRLPPAARALGKGKEQLALADDDSTPCLSPCGTRIMKDFAGERWAASSCAEQLVPVAKSLRGMLDGEVRWVSVYLIP